MTALVVALLAQFPLNQQPIDVRDHGTRQSPWRSWVVDCEGAGVACGVDGGVWTLSVTGGGGGGSTPTVSCGAGQALTWNGTAWNCVTKVGEAQAADASVYAQQAGVAASAYWADASVTALTAVAAQTAYAADASITAQSATSAQWAYAADASITARQWDHTPAACGTTQYASAIAADGTLTCSTPAGGGGGVTSVSGSTFITSSGGTAPTISLAATGTPSASTYLRGDNTWAAVSGGGGSANYTTCALAFDGGYDTLATCTAAWASPTSSIICSPLGEEASVEGVQAIVTARASGSFTIRGEPRMGRAISTFTTFCTGL